MAQKIDFVDKLLARIDRLDRESVQGYLAELAQDRKNTERILDEISEGILLLSLEGIVRYANRRAFRWLGFQRYAKDRSHVEALIQDPLVADFVRRCLARPLESSQVQLQVLSPHEMFLELEWIPLERKEVLLRVENRTQEKTLTDEEARLQRIEGLIRLAAGVAHEIGNPLNAVQIHLDLLQQEIKKSPKARQPSLQKYLQVIVGETKRLDQIVRSFLKATCLPPLRFRLDSVNEVLEEAVDFLEPEMNKQKARVKLTLDPSLPRFFLDRDRLHQAFINVLKNGIEAMVHGGTLTIRTVLRENLCLVRFTDQGKGIDDQDLPHIFEAYYTTKPEGSGLGLSQVYQAVRDHGGRIDVKSEKGKGSVFTLLLPIRRERLSLPQPERKAKEEVHP